MKNVRTFTERYNRKYDKYLDMRLLESFLFEEKIQEIFEKKWLYINY